MKKTIEQIIQLSKNPHYQLDEEETERLREYNQGSNVKNKNILGVHESNVPKHETDMEIIQPEIHHLGN